MGRFIFLMNGWSSAAGGIQTVNRELAVALAKLRPDLAISVLVPMATQAEINDATARGVELIGCSGSSSEDWLSVVLCDELKGLDVSEVIGVIGHSYFTGREAKRVRDSLFPAAKLIQFVHMSPLHTESLKEYRQDDYVSHREEKFRLEVEISSAADFVFCIGPRLHRSMSDTLTSRGFDKNKVKSINCGISRPSDESRVSPIQPTILCLGRTESIGVKGLDIFAYSAGILTARWAENPATRNLPPPQFIVRGAKTDPEGLETRLNDLAKEVGSSPAILVRPYTVQFEELSADYNGASILMMPSREEGYGLVACEALSRSVPILVSAESGFSEVVRQVAEEHHMRPDRCVVPMGGNIQEIADRYATSALEILVNHEQMGSYFQVLRERLLPVCSWDAGAKQFLNHFEALTPSDLPIEAQPIIALPPAAPKDQEKPLTRDDLLQVKGVLAVSVKQALVVIVEEGSKLNLPHEVEGIEVVIREIKAVKLTSKKMPKDGGDGVYIAGNRVCSIAGIFSDEDRNLFVLTAGHAVSAQAGKLVTVRISGDHFPVLSVQLLSPLDCALLSLPQTPHHQELWSPARPTLDAKVRIVHSGGVASGSIKTTELSAWIAQPGGDASLYADMFEVQLDGYDAQGLSGSLVEGEDGRPVGMIIAGLVGVDGSVRSYFAVEFGRIPQLRRLRAARLAREASNLIVGVVVSSSDVMSELVGALSVLPRQHARPDIVQCRMGVLGPTIYATTAESVGNVSSAIAAMSLLEAARPDVLIHIGPCEGANPGQQRLGDIIVATEVLSFASRRSPRESAFNHLRILGRENRTVRWIVEGMAKEYFDFDDIEYRRCKISYGTIASGENLSAEVRILQNHFVASDKAVGFDMESYGFAQAIEQKSHSASMMIVVRAIVDFDDREKADHRYRRDMATAVRAALDLVRKLSEEELPFSYR